MWREHRVERLNGAVLDVIMRRDAAEVRHGQVPTALVKATHHAGVQQIRGISHELQTLVLQLRIAVQSIVFDSIYEGILAHADEQKSIAEPAGSFFDVVHRAVHDFGVKVVGECFD